MSKFNKILFLIFLSPLIITLVISAQNLKQQSSIRLLVWKSPTLSIGMLMGLGCTTGFLLSATTCTLLAQNPNNNYFKRTVKSTSPNTFYEDEGFIDSTDNLADTFTSYQSPEEFPEHQINDPFPTVSVPFRVIKRGLSSQINNEINEIEYNYEDEVTNDYSLDEDSIEDEIYQDKNSNNFQTDQVDISQLNNNWGQSIDLDW